MTQIKLDSVGHVYQGKQADIHVLDNIDLTIEPQQFVCVLGPSGCGKTTLLKAVAGLIKPTQGSISFTEEEFSVKPRIGMMFQQANLLPWRNVLENVQLPLEISRPELTKEQLVEKAQTLITMTGLSGSEKMWVKELSGGMAQRVALARALIHEPSLLLLDEPFGSLDALTRENMGFELLRLWQYYRKTVVMVTHSISEALLLADRVIILSKRPANILLDISISFARPREAGLRYTAEFGRISEQIYKAIGSE